MEAVTSETEQLRERIKSLENDNDRLKVAAAARNTQAARATNTTTSTSQVDGSVYQIRVDH